MHSRPARLALVLVLAAGVLTVVLFARGLVGPGLLGVAAVAGLAGWGAWAARAGRDAASPAASSRGPRPATAPPDGHVRFTLVVEGLDPARVAEVWAALCRPDRPPSDELRHLFGTFTVVEGGRFRFLKGDPAETAALLERVLAAAAGVPVRTRLEPAAERTPPWS